MLLILIQEFLHDIRRQKLRTFLTLLAITWGTVAVVILLAFGEGIGNKMVEGLRGGGNRVIFVYGGQTSKPHEGLPVGRRIRLQEEDVGLLTRSIPGIEYISPSYARWNTRIRSEKASTSVFMEGVNPDYEEMRAMYPAAGGRFFNTRDVAQQRRVLFIGNKLAETLFGNESPIGKQVFVEDVPFTVIGVMAEKFQTSSMQGPDDNRALIPFTTFKTMYGHRYIHSLLVRPTDIQSQDILIDEMKRILGAKYKFDVTDMQALSIWDFIEFEQINQRIALGFQIFMFVVGFFTLLIAGVGVANIMYVVVKERTREIGVKKAVGARRRHIISQFVFESVFISLLGGVIGLGFSATVILGVQSLGLNDGAWQFFGHPVLSQTTMAVTVGILMVIGLVAGVFPARKAASVDPVESLRYE